MSHHLARRTIWIVDDSPIEAERAKRALAAESQVEVFHDGSVALERLAQAAAPDAIVIDWVMPGLSGLELTRFLRASANPDLARIAILLVTAARKNDQALDGLAAGADDFLAKPYEIGELRARVTALLGTRDLRRRLEVAEATSAQLLSLASEARITLDGLGRVTRANEAAGRLLGIDSAAITGLTIAEVIPGLAVGNIDVVPGESLFPIPDLEVLGRVLEPTVEVQPGSTTVVLRDVTSRRRAAPRRTDFFSIMSQDLRQPLSGALQRIDLLLRGKHGIMPARVIDEVRKVDAALHSLLQTTDDFLELARLEGIGVPIERSELDLGALLDQVLEDLSPLLEAKSVSWNPERPSRSVVVPAERRRLTQVITTLVAHALEVTPPRGTISTCVRTFADFVEASVTDGGVALSPDVLRSLFDRPLRRIGETPLPGTGLGFILARDVIRAHGGAVGAESPPAGSTTFWFRLPLAARARLTPANKVDSGRQ